MTIERYPRFGQALAPAILRPVLHVPLPRYWAKKLAPAELREMSLADLDSTAWKRFGSSACHALATCIVRQVQREIAASLAPIRRQPLPRIEQPLTINDLRLEVRTRNCLGRAGLSNDLRLLSGRTINDLLTLRGFGAKSLVDLLVSLETCKGVSPPSDPVPPSSPLPPLDSPLSQPLSLSWMEWAWGDFSFLPENAWEWTFPPLPSDLTLGQLDISKRFARRLRAHGFGTRLYTLHDRPILRLLKLPSFGLGALRRFLRALDAALHPAPQPAAADLHSELLDVFLRDSKGNKAKQIRNRRIFKRFYGLDGQGGATLKTVGDAEGISKERIRQLCLLRPRRGYSAPRLKPVLQVIAQLLPAPVADIEAELIRRGAISQSLPLKSLVQFARALDYPPPCTFVRIGPSLWAIRPSEHEQLFPLLVRASHQCIEQCGAASLARVASQATEWTEETVDPALARRLLSELADFYWLDEATGWFGLRCYSRNPLLRHLRRILAAVECLTIDELCDCIRRLPYGQWQFNALPPHVLADLCRHMPGVRIEGEDISADPPLDWRVVLHGIERDVIAIFHEHGPLLHWQELRKYGRDYGMTEAALHTSLSRIVTIHHPSHGFYRLCGRRSNGECGMRNAE